MSDYGRGAEAERPRADAPAARKPDERSDYRRFDALLRERERRFIAELRDLIALPTVSAQNSAIEETAGAVLARLRGLGARAEIVRVAGGAARRRGRDRFRRADRPRL